MASPTEQLHGLIKEGLDGWVDSATKTPQAGTTTGFHSGPESMSHSMSSAVPVRISVAQWFLQKGKVRPQPLYNLVHCRVMREARLYRARRLQQPARLLASGSGASSTPQVTCLHLCMQALARKPWWLVFALLLMLAMIGFGELAWR